MSANDGRVPEHYAVGGELHWDRMYRLYGRGYFVGCATKYIERYHLKDGKKDLEKAVHFLEKLKELEYPDKLDLTPYVVQNFNPEHEPLKSFPTGHPPDPGIEGMRCLTPSRPGEVKQWVDFTWEGGSTDYDLYTCKHCRKEVKTCPGDNPNEYHGWVIGGNCKPNYKQFVDR